MEECITVDVEKWIQSHVVEIEVSSEEKPKNIESSSFQHTQSQADFLRNDPSTKFKQLSSSTVTNRISLTVENDCHDENKSNLATLTKKQRKHKFSELETDYEFDGECGKFKCNRCRKYFLHKQNVILHLRNICGAEPKYVCPVCSFKTKSQITLKVHLTKFHSSAQTAARTDTLVQSFNESDKNVLESSSNMRLLEMNSQHIYQRKGDFSAMEVNETQNKYFQNDFETGLSEQDSSSCTEDSFQSEFEEEVVEELLITGAPEEETNVSDMEAVEQLKQITASLEKKTNSENKGVISLSNNNLIEPKKVIRYVDIDCASSSKFLNSYSEISTNKMSNTGLAKRYQQNIKSLQQFNDVEVQFIKIETPESDRMMKSFPERRKRVPKNIADTIESKNVNGKKTNKRRNKSLLDIHEDFEFDEDIEKFKCKRCEKHFKSKVVIINHLRNICGVEPKHVCPFCSFKTKFAVCLKVHIAKLHCGSQPMEKIYEKSKPVKVKTNKMKNTKKKVQDEEYDSDTSQSGDVSLSCGEDSYDSEFEDERNKTTKKVALWKENEFVYDVKQDIFKCKSCNQVFKSKGVVALHRHVACSSTSFSTVN